MLRPYLRNGVPGWTLEAQETALREAGAWNEGAIYRDDLSAAKVKARDPADLRQRAVMLKPSTRRGGAEVIAVASLRCLALSPDDLLDVLGAAEKRGATVRAIEEDAEIPPTPSAEALAGWVRLWAQSKRRGETEGARMKGVQAAAETKNFRTAAALAAIRDEWRNSTSTVSTADLIERTGLSRRTVEKGLLSREAAKAEAQRTIKPREARQAKRATK